MAKTLTTSWQTIGSYTVYPSGYTLTFYMDARYTSQSIANNTTTIETRLRSVHSNSAWSSDYHTFECSYADTVSYHGRWTYETETITSGSGTITHNNDGTKSLWLQGYVYDSAWGWNNYFGDTVYLPSIPRQANISTAPDFNDEENPTVTYSNPAGNSVSELVIGIFNTDGSVAYAPYRSVNKTGTLSYTFELTSEERIALRQACTGNSMAVKFFLRTTLGGTYYYSSSQKTMTIVNGSPTFSNFTFADTNPTTVALTGNNQNIIKGYSNVTATVSTANKATANKEATMSKYRLSCGSNTPVDFNYSNNSSVSGTINGVTDGIFTLQAIDSRGNSKPVTKNANSIIDYKNITKGNISATRSNGISKETTLTFNGTWWNDSFAHQETNLRHIEIGDDLSGKTLYFMLPDNIHQSIINDILGRDDTRSVIANEIYGKAYIKETYFTSRYGHSASLYLAMWDYEQQTGDTTTIYEASYEGGISPPIETVTTNISTLTLPNDFGVVTLIDDTTATYQYIYVGEEMPNVISASYKYKKTSESSYPQTSYPLTLTTSGNNYSFSGLIVGDEGNEGFNINYSYDIQVIVEDELSSATFTTQLSSGIPHIAYAKDGVGIMGKYDTNVGGLLQVGGQRIDVGDTLPINSIFEYSGNTVPDGYEEVKSYTTEEIRIGTARDGKPLYQKTIVFTTTATEYQHATYVTTISNLKKVYNFSGSFIKEDANQLPLAFYYDTSNYVRAWVYLGQLYYSCMGYVGYEGNVTIEYTKTTD